MAISSIYFGLRQQQIENERSLMLTEKIRGCTWEQFEEIVTIPPAKPEACICEPLKAVDLLATSKVA